jgi:hypothetical protein
MYTFISTKIAATPGTVYWTASFTLTPQDCEGPSTFTTPVHTFTVVAPASTEEPVVKQKQEEAVAIGSVLGR